MGSVNDNRTIGIAPLENKPLPEKKTETKAEVKTATTAPKKATTKVKKEG